MSLINRIKNEVRALRDIVYYKMYYSPKSEKDIVRNFHKLYYDSNVMHKTWRNTYWLGVRALKCPLDLWIYQEIIYEQKPDVIIETGTANGGSARYLATMCDFVNNGKIITVDIENVANRPQHKRIQYLLGSSISKEIVEQIKKQISDKDKVMVILDSDHRKDHVLEELKIYSKFVTKGSYLIVEDSNVNGHPVNISFGPGPYEAIEEFLKENKNFVIDEEKEKFLMTFNPSGYLRKI
ncbi:MAG: CmcI family methyltransferase [Elusimicrobia bacterium]|nr:CmcI family methyltransferase [Elusimicrobiota bacterium]